MSEKFDLAEQFGDLDRELNFRFVEMNVERGLSDKEIIEAYKEYDSDWDEESIRFVK